MCWMTLHRGPFAATQALSACRAEEVANGGHSWGYAVATADGTLKTGHGLGAIPPYPPADDGPDVTAALGHTRKATQGDITIENAHPFIVRDTAGHAVAALAHNGTWTDAPQPPDDDRCDSYYIAQDLQTRYQNAPDQPFKEIVRETGDYVGETITVLHRDGRGFAYSGRYGITKAESWIRSSGGIPIPDRVVATV